MAKRERLEVILSSFNDEERELLESLGVKRLYRALDTMPDDNILIEQLRAILPSIAQKLEEVAKEKKESEKKEAVRDRARIETVEPIEFLIPKFGMFTIPKPIFELFMKEFNFSANEAHRKVVNLFIYYPKRVPLITIQVNLDAYTLETLFTDTLEEYLLLNNEDKNYSTFCGLFSQQVFSLLADIGTKTVRKGNRITHVTPQLVSFEELRERELNQLDEYGEELEA